MICQLEAKIDVDELDFDSSYQKCLDIANKKMRDDNMKLSRRGYDEHKGEEALCKMFDSSSFNFPSRDLEYLKRIGLGSFIDHFF